MEPMTCEASGVPLVWEGRGNAKSWSPSLDRIDPSKGYTEENVRVGCWLFNRAKGNGSDSEVLLMAKSLVRKLNET